jgi:hypothetical protein
MGRILSKDDQVIVEIEPEKLLDSLFYFAEFGPRMVSHAVSCAARGILMNTRYAEQRFSSAAVTWSREKGMFVVVFRKASPEDIAAGRVFKPKTAVVAPEQL